jgi:hypothetical protein
MQNSNLNLRGTTVPTAYTQATLNSTNSLKTNLVGLQQRSQLSLKSKVSDVASVGEVSVFGAGRGSIPNAGRNQMSRSPVGQSSGMERTM